MIVPIAARGVSAPHRRVCALVMAGIFLVGCAADDENSTAAARASDKPVPKVRVHEVDWLELETVRSWPGALVPLRVHELAAPAEGRIDSVEVEVASRVEEGDLLARFSFPEEEAARAALADRVDSLALEAERLEALVARGAVGESEATRPRLEYLQAREVLQRVDALLERRELRAPAAGEVMEIPVGTGAALDLGDVVMRLAESASIGLRLDIPSGESRYFREPTQLEVVCGEGAALEVERIVRPGEIRPGRVRMELWTGQGEPGEAVKVRYAGRREALVVPWTSVAVDDHESWVARVDPGSGEIERRMIEPGETRGTWLEVLSGLEAGDRVVLFEPRQYAAGTRIEPVGDEPDEEDERNESGSEGEPDPESA